MHGRIQWGHRGHVPPNLHQVFKYRPILRLVWRRQPTTILAMIEFWLVVRSDWLNYGRVRRVVQTVSLTTTLFRREKKASRKLTTNKYPKISLLWLQSRENKAFLPFPLDARKLKGFQLQGASLPWPPDQGLCPWTPLGATPVIGSRSALSPCVPPKVNSWIRHCLNCCWAWQSCIALSESISNDWIIQQTANCSRFGSHIK